MKYIVEALDVYKKLGIKDNQLNHIPVKGEKWEVSKHRLDILLGKNYMKLPFVKNLGENKPKKEVETCQKKQTKT